MAAAGNDGNPACSFPAGYGGVIGVGSVAALTGERAEYSNYGDCVHIAVDEGLAEVSSDRASADVDGGTIHLGTSFAGAYVTAKIADVLRLAPGAFADAQYGLVGPNAIVAILPTLKTASGFHNKVGILLP